MKYYCEICDRDVNDLGPYERSDGEYECQDCMEGHLEGKEELMLEQYMERYYESLSTTSSVEDDSIFA